MERTRCDYCGGCNLVKDNNTLVCQGCGYRYPIVKPTEQKIPEDVIKLDDNKDQGITSPSSSAANHFTEYKYANKAGKIAFIITGIAFIGMLVFAIVRISTTMSLSRDNYRDTYSFLDSINGKNENFPVYFPTEHKRSATMSDINITIIDSFSSSMNFELTPNADIQNLQITIIFLDSHNRVKATKICTVGNVTKDVQYMVTIGLADVPLSDILTITKTTTSVTGGTVVYWD